jgi:hypothetical protein
MAIAHIFLQQARVPELQAKSSRERRPRSLLRPHCVRNGAKQPCGTRSVSWSGKAVTTRKRFDTTRLPSRYSGGSEIASTRVSR